MKTRNLFSLMSLGLFLLVFAACDRKPVMTEVPYTVLKHYFFRNDAQIPSNPKIDTQERFDSLFGMAPVMGADGKPTPVDFERQFVISVVLPVTNQQTELYGEHLYAYKDLLGKSNLYFWYSANRGSDTLSYTMQPILLIAVDRQHDAEYISLKEVVDE